MFSQHAVVLSAMEPETRLPEASAGIWPETKMWGPEAMAWDCWEMAGSCQHSGCMWDGTFRSLWLLLPWCSVECVLLVQPCGLLLSLQYSWERG